VPGVARVSLAYLCGLNEEQYCSAAVQALGEAGPFETFKVHAKRSSTTYELHTLDIHRLVGGVLCDAFPEKKVQMHGPDVIVNVIVSQASVYVYASSRVGVGGLPVGTAGKVVTLLSSGFDSPVATWMVGRRGAICVPVHFSGRPMTSDSSEWLCQDIVQALEPAGMIGRLYVVPFGDCQREISLAVPQSLRIITYRRVMMAVSERIALLEGAKALVTGESLGQVASQTLDNIAAVNEAVSMPILRPLIGSDKIEIMRRAEQIGTHEISSQAAEDCCTLFMPRKPETHARMQAVHEAWDAFDHDAMIERLVETVEYKDYDHCPSYRPPKEMRVRHRELEPREA
jgi:thiamine biosynthesis protein ThiI